MTRLSLIVFAAALLASCGGVPEAAQDVEPSYIIGPVERAYLNDPAWPEFAAVYDTTRIDPRFIEMIRATYQGERFLVFFGAWCGDSKRDLPRFFRIADEAGFASSAVSLYSLDRTKKSPDGMTDRYGIVYVPTFIVLNGDSEVGRITEFPQVSIEADLLTILAAARAK